MQGRVSIVIPTYDDDPAHLAEAVASAQGQTWPDVEVVVVDDGSPTPVELDGVRVIRQDNAGPSAARNTGIRATTGEVVICLDADDLLSPTYAAEAVQVLADPAVMAAYPRVRRFGAETGEWWAGSGPVRVGAFAVHGAICGTSAFRRADWERVGGYDESLLVGHEDHEWWIRLLGADGAAVSMPTAVLRYRIRPESRGRARWREAREATRAAILRNNDAATVSALLVGAWGHGDVLEARLAAAEAPSLARRAVGRVRRAVRARR